MRLQSLALATLTLALAAACGPRPPDCGSNGLVYVEGMGCVCPMGTRFVCDEGTTVCICEALDAGATPDASDAGVPADAPADAGCNGPGEMMCGTTCVDTRTSTEHCGACASPCAVRCSDGTCVDPAVEVAAGLEHTCARRESGAVACWGRNGVGQLGDGTVVDRPSAVPVVDLPPATRIGAGGVPGFGRLAEGLTCALTADGAVYCWGLNELGQASGDGSTGSITRPARVASVPPASRLGVGATVVCVTTTGRRLYCWGSNGASTPSPSPVAEIVPAGFAGAWAATVDVIGSRPCAATATGEVLCAGSTPRLEQIPGFSDVREVRSGPAVCALTDADQVVCWGPSRLTGTGGTGTDTVGPSVVPSVTDARDLASGMLGTTCVVRGDAGELVCWGYDLRASLTEGTARYSPDPVVVDGLPPVVDVAIGATHACVVTDDGRVACWGANGYGQLGDGTTDSTPDPVWVAGFP